MKKEKVLKEIDKLFDDLMKTNQTQLKKKQDSK